MLHKPRQKNFDYASIVDLLKKKKNDEERSSTSSIEEQQQIEKLQKQMEKLSSDTVNNYTCCPQNNNINDDYQLITECWIEPQHGSVVVNNKQNYKYMSGLMYQQLADAVSNLFFSLKYI